MNFTERDVFGPCFVQPHQSRLGAGDRPPARLAMPARVAGAGAVWGCGVSIFAMHLIALNAIKSRAAARFLPTLSVPAP